MLINIDILHISEYWVIWEAFGHPSEYLKKNGTFHGEKSNPYIGNITDDETSSNLVNNFHTGMYKFAH